MSITRHEYASDLLHVLGIQTGPRHRGAKRALVTWMHAEDGEHPGVCNGNPGQGACWNPYNTTLPWPGATDYNTVGVKNYQTLVDGLAATASTLQEPRYALLVAALAKPNNTAQTIFAAIGASPWGTSLDLLTKAYTAVTADYPYYAGYPCGPEG